MIARLCCLFLFIALLAACSEAPAPDAAARASGSDAASSRSETKTYTSAPQGGVNCASNAGGACFELQGGEQTAGMLVNDAEGWVGIPLDYRFMAADGSVLAEGSLCDRGYAPVPAGAVQLVLEVTALAAQTECNALSVTQGGDISVTYALAPGPEPELDGERGCIGGFVPEPLSMSLQGMDTGQRISLEVLVLLDQGAPGPVDSAQARASMERVVAAYDAIGIGVVHELRSVPFITAAGVDDGLFDKDEMFNEARAMLGGSVPAGFDLVHIMTTKDIRAAAGYADCVGGIRSRQNAFSIAEEVTGKPPNIIRGVPAPVWPWNEVEGYISTHEIGHLLGGNHDYADCAQGLADGSGAPPGPCTIMHPNLNISFQFSALNRTEIREYAIRFAAP